MFFLLWFRSRCEGNMHRANEFIYHLLLSKVQNNQTAQYFTMHSSSTHQSNSFCPDMMPLLLLFQPLTVRLCKLKTEMLWTSSKILNERLSLLTKINLGLGLTESIIFCQNNFIFYKNQFDWTMIKCERSVHRERSEVSEPEPISGQHFAVRA